MRRALAPVLAVVGIAAALSARPSPTPPGVYEDMAVDLLQKYLQIDTTNPPGNELKAAVFFKEVLERDGIPVEIDEFAPGRANVLASLKGSGAKRPLILLNHMDVVPADPARWSVPPFSGMRKDGLIYGRGAQDMKSEGILQLVTMIRLKREGIRLQRDVLFVGTADEEVDFAGALRVLSVDGWRDRVKDAEFAITEGGENLLDEKASGAPVYFGIETAEKGPFWLKLRTSGTPGHGSRPIADSAVNRLVRALDRVRQHKTEMKVLPTVEKFFRDQAGRVTGPRAEWYRDVRKALRDPAAAQALYDDRDVTALLRNTISLTVLKAGYKTNVIPGTAEAELDVRLLPGEDPQAFLAELKRVIDDPSVEIVLPATFRSPNQSPADSELFRAAESTLARHFPGVPVTTKMLTGATECVLFRPVGIHCYGFTPLLTTRDEIATTHGDDERVREDSVRRSTGLLYDVVREVAAGGAAPEGKPSR